MNKPYPDEVAEAALRMARARRMRLDAKRILSATGPKCEEVEILRAKRDLSAARIEWRSASSRLWRLAEKVQARNESAVMLDG